MPNKSQSVPPLDGNKATTDEHGAFHQEKDHHHGEKEMPTSLPNQRVAPDGKKLPMTDAEKAAAKN